MHPRRKRARAPCNPQALELAQKANDNQSSHEFPNLLDRITSSDPTRRPRDDHIHRHPAIAVEPSPAFSAPQASYDIVDTPDKLLAYCLHVIEANVRVDPSIIQLKEVRTVADAVFAPARKPVEIHYLLYDPSPPCHFSNVYWLARASVESLDLKQPYFTLTSHELTHVMGADTEVHDVATWLTEKAIFDQIVQMPCIQLMRKMTMFHTWKQNSIGMRFARARKHLMQKLIWCNAVVLPHVLPLRRMALQIARIAASSIVEKSTPVTFKIAIEINYEPQVSELQAAVSAVEDVMLVALTPLLQDHARYGAFAASTDVIPTLIRVMDLMVVEALFDAVTASMERLLHSLTGVTTSQGHGPPDTTAESRDAHSQVDYLLASPFEHTGNVAYKRLFQLQSAQRAPDPLWFVHIAIHDSTHCTISPPKESWLRKLHDLLARYIAAIDSVGRICATPRVRQFVHDHCRPYYRHYFANNIHSLSAIVHNHAHVATLMTRLRTAMDIYFAEIEHLASTCLPLKAEFRQLQATPVPQTQASVEAIASTAEASRVMHMYIAFRRELTVVDSMLQVGCFLVDRSNFVGNMLQECNSAILDMYDALPLRIQRFMAAVSDELAHQAATMASIPESVDECTAWLECFSTLQRKRSSNVLVEPQLNALKKLIESSDRNCDLISDELRATLTTSFEAGSNAWRFKMKALAETTSRIEANQPFYLDLFRRTHSTRRDILALEFNTVSAKLDHAMATVRLLDPFPDNGFGGPDVQNLLQVVRHLVDQSAHLLKFSSLVDGFRANGAESTKAVLRQRRHSTRQMSIDHVYKQHDRLNAVLVLLGMVQSYVQLRTPTTGVALVDLDLLTLLTKVATLKRQSLPYCAILGGAAYPLVSQFYPSIQTMHDAVQFAATMTHAQFTDARWERLAPYLERPGAATCTLQDIETALQSSDATQLLTELHDAVRVEARIKDTIAGVKSVVAALTFEFEPDSHHDLHVTNCLALITSLEDAHMTLLAIRHGQNPWLRDVERLETRILAAIAVLGKIHDMESQWSIVSSAATMPEVQAHVKDASLWVSVDAMEATWRDCLLAVYRWEDPGSRKSNVMVKLETVFQDVDFSAFLGLCDRIRSTVDSYLDTLRTSFARLHFVSNDDMLQLFRSPNQVVLAIQWCYPGVGTVHSATTQPSSTAEPSPRTTAKGSSQIAGLMDADFMTWLLGDHAVAFVNSVDFRCTADKRAPWTLPLYRPVKILGSLSFWLGQFDIILAHSLASSFAHMKATYTPYDPLSPSTASPMDDVVAWSATLPPQVALSLLHFQFCSVVGRIVEPSPKRVTSSKTLLASTASAHRAYLTKLVAAMRGTNECSVGVEDAIVLLAYQDSVLQRLNSLSGVRDWVDVVHEWEHSFRLAEAAPSSAESAATSTMQARMGHLVVPCGLDVQPKMPWMIILPETQRCMFALLHAMRLSACVLPFGGSNTGKHTLIRGLGYLLMRCQWQLDCNTSTTHRQLSRFLAGISAVHGWGCIESAFELPVTLLGMLMAELDKLQHARVLHVASTCDDARMTCTLFLPYQSSVLTQSKVARWLGEPLRSFAVPPPDLALALHVIMASKGFTNEGAIRLVHSVLTTLFASSPHTTAFYSMRLLQRIASTAHAITKQVSYIIHSPHGGKGSHLRHDASPLNTSRYKDTNVFRFALLLVLEPLGIFPRGQLYTVVDQFVPSSVEMTQENRMVTSAFNVVLEREQYVPIPSLVQKGVELHQVLQSAMPAILVGSTATGKSTCLKVVLRSMQLLDSLLRKSNGGVAADDDRVSKIHLTVVPFDELTVPSTALSILSDVVKARANTKVNCVCFDGMVPSSGVVFEYVAAMLASHTTLRLPNGRSVERVAGNPMVVMEVVSLANLSPSMLTNCTVLCMDNVVITWQNLLERWVHQQPPKDHPTFALLPFLHDTIHRFVVEFALPFQATMPKYPMTLLMANILHLVAAVYDSMLPSVTDVFLEQCTFLAVMWGIGSYLSAANRVRLQSFVQQAVHEKRQTTPWPSLDALFMFCLENACTFFDTSVDLDENRITSVSNYRKSPKFVASTPHSTTVATPQMQFASGLYSMLQSRGVSMVVTGSRGSGKSTALHHLASLAGPHDPQMFLHTPSLAQHALLKRWMLRTNAGREVAFVDDVGLDDPRVFRLCRNAVGSQRLFDANSGTWAAVHATIYASVGDAQLDKLSDHERLRFLRHFYVVKLTEPSPDELVSIHTTSCQRSLGRPLQPDEMWIVQRTISTLQHVKRHSHARILPQYHFGEGLIQHILQSTLAPSIRPEDMAWTWLVNVKTFVWDALATDDHRRAIQNDIKAAGSEDVVAAVDFDGMVWNLPWVSAIHKSRHTTEAGSVYRCVRDHIVAEYLRLPCVHGKVDLVWLRAMNSHLVVHWIKLTDALQTNKQVIVVGDDRHCHDNIVKLVAHLSHAKYMSCHDVAAPAGVTKLLENLCEVTGVADERAVVSIHDDALTKWPTLWSFVLDFFRGHSTAASQAFVAKYTQFLPASMGAGNDHLVHDFMERMRRNLCCVVHFRQNTTATEPSHLDALLAHRSIPTTVISAPSYQDNEAVETTMGFMVHLADQHKELGLSETECNKLARTCADVHSSVGDFFTVDPRPSIFNLLHAFKHLLELRSSVTFGGGGHADNVTKTVDLLEGLRASFGDAQKIGAHWDEAYESCRVRQAALKKVSFSMETSVSTNSKSTFELEQKTLPVLQQQLDEVLAAVEHEERQLRIDRKALDHVVVGAITARDKQRMLGEWKTFQPLVRMTSALCLAFGLPDVSTEAACDLLEDPAFDSKLVHLDLPPQPAGGPFQQALAFALADVAVLHTKQPTFAAIVRWLNFKSIAATAVETLAGLHARQAQIAHEIESCRATLAQLRADAADLGVHIDTIRMLREELSMEAAEAKVNYNVAKREAARLFPLQSFVEFYLTWLRSKYWVHATSTLTSLLYLASVVAYSGWIAPPLRPEWMATLASTLTRRGFVLPLETSLVADSTASLVSVLEGDVCFAHRDSPDKSMRENLVLADWSPQTPLFIDPYGIAEAALVHFFTRMHVALPGTHHTVLSCLDPKLLDRLNHALLDNALVVLHHFSMDKYDLVRPFLHHRRNPLTHQLLLKQAKRSMPRHHSSVNSLALTSTEAPSRKANGTFQLYLVTDERVALTPQVRSLLNVLDCSAPNVQPLLETHIEALVGPRTCGNLQASVNELADLQTFVDMHALLVNFLAESQRVPTRDHLIQSILKYDQHRRTLEAKLVSSEDSPSPSLPLSDDGCTSFQTALSSSATLIAQMMHALHHLEPVASHCMHSVLRMRKLMTAVAHEGMASAADSPPVRVAHLVQRLHVVIASSLPRHCRRLFDCLLAIQRTTNAPPLIRVTEFLASVGCDAVPPPAATQRPQRNRLSVHSAGHSHVHRLRRMHSIVGNHSVPTTDTKLSDASANEDATRPVNIPHRDWMARWNSVEMFHQLHWLEAWVPECEGISTHIRRHSALWHTSVTQALQASPPLFVLPHTWPTALSPFHRMLLVRCICPDLVVFHMDLFIEDALSRDLALSKPPQLVLSPLVLVVADTQSDLMTCPPLGGKTPLNLRSRVIVDPATPAPLMSALDAGVAKGGTVVVELLRAEDFAEFYRIFRRTSKSHQTTKTCFDSHRVVVVCTLDVARSLPFGFVQTTQTISLPLDGQSIFCGHDQSSPMHAHSTMASLSRGLLDVQKELVAWNTWHAVGWRGFIVRSSHIRDMAATLSYIGQLNVSGGNEPSAVTAALTKRVVTAVQDGVLGADMTHGHDRDCLLRRFVATWVAESYDHRGRSAVGTSQSSGNGIGGVGDSTGFGVAPRMATFMSNVLLRTSSWGVVQLCRSIAHVPSHADQEVHAIAVCRRIFRSFLHLHYAHTRHNIEHVDHDEDDNDTTASGTMLVTVAALKFRRSVKKLHVATRDCTVVLGLLQEDLAQLNALWLHCLDRLDHCDASSGELQLLVSYHLPPEWMGLPPTAAPVPLASFAPHMTLASDFFSGLKLGMPPVIPLGYLCRPDRFFAGIRLHNASVLNCDISQLHLVLDACSQPSTDSSGVVFSQLNGAPVVCSVVVSGLWLFNGHDNRPLMDKLLPLHLHVSSTPPLLDANSPRGFAVQLPWYSLWSLEHVGAWQFGDSRVFQTLEPKLWYKSMHPLPRPESTVILCPALDVLPNAADLLQRPSSSKPLAHS